MTDLSAFLTRVLQTLDRLDAALPPAVPLPDWTAPAHRWRMQSGRGYLQAIHHPQEIKLSDLQGIDEQIALCKNNTRQFLKGFGANNILLTGSRGTGKSSIVKALLSQYRKQGLRVIEVDKEDLIHLPDIVALVADRPERFIIFCDDLSFESGEGGYKALKTILDGTLSGASTNVLIYATSNRRHLLPEFMNENLQARQEGGEIHPGESVEEKISLSERFGLWVSFYPFTQDEYLAAVRHWLSVHGVESSEHPAVEQEALNWATHRGSRSGRVAWHFARQWAGAQALKGGKRVVVKQ